MELIVDGPGGRHPAYVYTGGRAFDPALPCVVFIHGALNDHSVWTLLARWYAYHGHAVLALDLPGHARSGGPPAASVEQAAQWLLALLDAAGVAEAALVGHSMGSLIALQAAALASARCRSLALLGTAYPMTVAPALLETARETPLEAIDRVNAWSHSTWAAKPSYPAPGIWLHGASRALMRRVQSRQAGCNLFLHDFNICNDYAGGLDAAAKVTAPTALILGRRDQMTAPRQARALAAALKAQVIEVEAGHALMAEAPDAVLSALQQALA